jgi:hypothetical protein
VWQARRSVAGRSGDERARAQKRRVGVDRRATAMSVVDPLHMVLRINH